MSKKRQPMPEPTTEFIRDEAIHIPKGDTVYTIDLDEQTVEELQNGVCSDLLARRMFDLLSWRREALRQDARTKAPLFQEKSA